MPPNSSDLLQEYRCQHMSTIPSIAFCSMLMAVVPAVEDVFGVGGKERKRKSTYNVRQ